MAAFHGMRIRAVAGMADIVDQLEALSLDVIAESRRQPLDREGESRALAEFIDWLAPMLARRHRKQQAP